jgi:large subunit ribosomal protein L17
MRAVRRSQIRDEAAVRKLFGVLGDRYAERSAATPASEGRFPLWRQRADGRHVELVDRDVDARGAKDRARVALEAASEEEAA